MSFLIGEKIKLRPVEPDDIDLMMQWENEPINWEVNSTIAPYSRHQLQQYIDHAHLDIYHTGQLRFMIEDLKASETIGTIDLFEFEPFHQRVGVGILIGDEKKRQNGYATESIMLIIEYCFEHLGLNQIFANILEDNKASLRLFEKAGFAVTGSKKRWVRHGRNFKDEHFLQLLKPE